MPDIGTSFYRVLLSRVPALAQLIFRQPRAVARGALIVATVDLAMRAAHHDELRELLQRLPVEQRACLLLHAEGFRYAEIAQFDNVPMRALRLVTFSVADLPSVAAWFDDPDTRRWLGDCRWPEMILGLAGDRPADHRGRGVVERSAWMLEEDDVRVGMIDVEVYDDRTAGLALVVAPAHRGRGVARRALGLVARQLAARGVHEVFGGVETDNAASIRCVEAAGFTRRSDEPDAEGFLYFARRTRRSTPC